MGEVVLHGDDRQPASPRPRGWSRSRDGGRERRCGADAACSRVRSCDGVACGCPRRRASRDRRCAGSRTTAVRLASAPRCSSDARRGRGCPRGMPLHRDRRRRIAARAAQQPSARPATTRTTESSIGRTIGRSWTRKRSAMPASRVSASRSSVAIGSSDAVAAGRDDREAELAQQQMMQRRIGQHRAEPADCPARPHRRAPSARRRRSRTIGRSGAERAAAILRGVDARSSRRTASSVGNITANGFSSRRLRARRRRHGRVVARVDQEMEAADALHRDDPPVADARRRRRAARRPRSRQRAPVGIPERQLRPAVGAGVRLGVEAAVGGILVFGAAGGAHRETPHRGAGAVVGQVLDDAVARAAVRAVDERIAVAAVGGIEQLAQAVVAGGEVGQHRGAARPVVAARRGWRSRRSPRRDRRAASTAATAALGGGACADGSHQRGDALGRSPSTSIVTPAGDVADPAGEAQCRAWR